MPSAEAALVSMLTGGSPNPVATIVGARVYPEILPQNPILPSIRYQRVSTARAQYRTMRTGRSDYVKPRFQIDCFAVSKSGALALAAAVRQQLAGFAGVSASVTIGSSALEDEASDIEEGVGEGGASIYRHRMDFLIGHAET